MQIDSKTYLLMSVPAFFAVALGMYWLDGFLRTNFTPFGILSFEFIKTPAQASQALNAWGDVGRVATGVSLGLDFLFIVLYVSIALVLLRMMANRLERFDGRLAGWARWSLRLAIGAGVLDVIENTALIQILLGSDYDFWPGIAYWCAAFKFTFLGLILGVAAFSVVKILNHRG